MLRAEVVEHRDVEDAAVDPAEDQRVAGDLHRDGVHAPFAHHGEQGLEVGGLGGGAFGLEAFVADACLDGADESGDPVGRRVESALDEVRGGGLAGGAGDADLEQALAGVAVDGGREGAHPGARVVDDQDGQSGGGGAVESRGIGQHRRGAEVGGLRGEVGAVETGARQRGVQITGADRPGVMGDAGDLVGGAPVGRPS